MDPEEFLGEYPDPTFSIREPEKPFYRIFYWKDGVRCFDPNTWDRCTIVPVGMYTYGEQEFTRAEALKIKPLLSLLDIAFESGRWHAKKEIREVLGVK